MSDDSAARSGRLWAATKPWLIWLIFFVAGPFIGVCAALMASSVEAISSQSVERTMLFMHNPFKWPIWLLHSAVWDYPWAQLLGGLQAGFVGFVAAGWYLVWGRVSFWAVIIASLVCVAFALIISLSRSYYKYAAPSLSNPAPGWKEVVFVALVHVAAAAGCWVLVAGLRNHNPRKLKRGVAA